MLKRNIALGALTALVVSLGGVAVATSATAHDGGAGRGPGGVLSELKRAEMASKREAHTKVITDTLGLSSDAIKTRLQNGESLATIAGTKKSALIDALVAFYTKEIDAAVSDGYITSAQATTMKSELKADVTAAVEATPRQHFGKRGENHRASGKRGGALANV